MAEKQPETVSLYSDVSMKMELPVVLKMPEYEFAQEEGRIHINEHSP